MQRTERNILIAVDGSNNSFEAVRYVGRLMPAAQTRITLLHIFNVVPESYWDLDVRPQHAEPTDSFAAWQQHQKELIQAFMETAGIWLSSMGFDPEGVSALIKEREVDVARDIAGEAGKGYDALVLGRKGIGDLKDLIFGSVANKLVTHLQQVPIWVVGNRPDPSKILVAMDKSAGAMRALEYVTDVLAHRLPELLLLHVTRGLEAPQAGDEQESPRKAEDWLRSAQTELAQAEQAMQRHFQELIEKLEHKGVDRGRIRSKIVPGVYSRAGAIFGEALTGGYGTVVLGRRGLSRVEEFMMGRVSSKVLQLAQEMAVWIVQ